MANLLGHKFRYAPFAPASLQSYFKPKGENEMSKTKLEHHGFQALNEYIAANRPKVLIHGHQHFNAESRLGETRVIGTYGCKLIEICHG